jgi:hypothetical protein
VPAGERKRPVYTVVKVGNVFDSPDKPGARRWIAYPRPFVIVQHFDGLTGDLLYAETIQRENTRSASSR